MRTIEWKSGIVVLIDQTRLPEELVYVECGTSGEVADAIRTMKIRGAPAIGVAAAMGLALEAYNSTSVGRGDLLAELRKAAEKLRMTRPTAVNLFWAISRMLGKARSAGGTAEDVKERLIAEAVAMAEEDVEVNRAMGKHGAALLEEGDAVLTHCNAGALATVDYGTALGVIRAAVGEGKEISVIASETRPRLQGARLTAFELQADRIPVTVITDNMVGYVMQKGKVKKVVVGADRILADGHVFNKIGTFSVAVLAKHHGVPFYVAAPTSTIDLETKLSGAVIEERSPLEVTTIAGHRIVPEGVAVLNPAFDLTPPDLVSAIITECGVLYSPFVETIPHLLLKKNRAQ